MERIEGGGMFEDWGLSLDEIVKRLTAQGYTEGVARQFAETHSVVFKYALDEPMTRYYLDIHLELMESRCVRRLNGFENRIIERLNRLEAQLKP